MATSTIRYGTVVGQFLSSSVDGSDSDTVPDIIPLKGSIVFSAAPAYVLDYSSSPNPVTISTSHVTCTLDSEGYLCGPPATPNGPLTRGVSLVATDNANIVPSMWTWTVTYVLRNKYNNKQVSFPVQYINVPSDGIVDLTNVAKIASSNGTIITKGLKGDIGPSGTVEVGTTVTSLPGSSASVSATGTPSSRILHFTIPRGEAGPAGPTGSDATVTPENVAANLPARLSGETLQTRFDGKADLVSGKVPTSQLPGLALIDVNTVASEAGQLALVAQEGDVAIRSDINKSYVHNGGTAGTMADWSELITPTDQVQSVNGKTGVVTVTKADVGLGNADNTSDAAKPISTATQSALNAKASLTGIETLTNKTLNAPVINNPSGFLTGAAKITVGTVAPVSPTTGDLWIDMN